MGEVERSSGFIQYISILGQDKTTPLKDGTYIKLLVEDLLSRITVLTNAYTAADIQLIIIITIITTVTKTVHLSSGLSKLPKKIKNANISGGWKMIKGRGNLCV